MMKDFQYSVDRTHKTVKHVLGLHGLGVVDLAGCRSHPGVPDLLVVWRGRCAFVEVKNGRPRYTEWQERFYLTWSESPIYVCRSMDEAIMVATAVKSGQLIEELLLNRNALVRVEE